MIVYAESSAVLRWLFNEAEGDAIRAIFQDAERVACSRLTLLETRRAIRRALFMRQLTEAAARDLLGMLAMAAAHWTVLEMTHAVAERAAAAFPNEPVRTLDALHLASAVFLREQGIGLSVVSTDERVRSNAQTLGFEVAP